jgi:hypothetical protein
LRIGRVSVIIRAMSRIEQVRKWARMSRIDVIRDLLMSIKVVGYFIRRIEKQCFHNQ